MDFGHLCSGYVLGLRFGPDFGYSPNFSQLGNRARAASHVSDDVTESDLAHGTCEKDAFSRERFVNTGQARSIRSGHVPCLWISHHARPDHHESKLPNRHPLTESLAAPLIQATRKKFEGLIAQKDRSDGESDDPLAA
jgi:hypothetical protein